MIVFYLSQTNKAGLPGESEIRAALSLVLRKRPGPGFDRAAGGALPLLRFVDAFQVLPQTTFVTLAILSLTRFISTNYITTNYNKVFT